MISVITPTYNRAYTLENLKKSLCNQTKNTFEWVIIDDGSTDNTRELVSGWIKEDLGFPVRYYLKENGGKHRALNYGIPLLNGEYVFIVDSDDMLTNDAIERVCGWIDSIKNRPDIAGVAGLRGYPNGKVIGQTPKKNKYIDAKNSHRYIHHLNGDKAEIYRKELMVQHPFPEYEGEKFIGEGAVWNQLALEGFKVRWFNRVIYICQYLEDGLTRNADSLNMNNFRGYTNNTKLNYKAIVFPFNLMAVAVYIDVAKKLNHGERWVKDAIGVSSIDWTLIRIIRSVRGMK